MDIGFLLVSDTNNQQVRGGETSGKNNASFRATKSCGVELKQEVSEQILMHVMASVLK